ncbi:MAG TPA: lipoyl(octanoyl) transferase LipB [Terriglobia bacterium]|nr:lipoyl(octanoyl) transferase LipB [Terriglobia bacterium]HVB28405.1 lipoyl(octanoyl) transferase LipB [Terriglobia bacterium]
MICQVELPGVIGYREGLRLQHERVLARKAGTIADTLLLLEHPPVYTLGRNANHENILFSPERLRSLGAEVFETDRGGDVTYHGPGQLVGYPILDLTRHQKDLSWYMHSLEEVFIRVAHPFGIQAGRLAGARGVWVGNDKLVAMGVHVSRWVTSHGFAFNVNTDLRFFDWIVPCGLHGKGVTSLEKLLGRPVSMEAVTESVIRHFGDVFGVEMKPPGQQPAASGPQASPAPLQSSG